jgi:hypothetical protein
MFDMRAFVNRYAEVGDLANWANDIMSSREADFTVEDGDKRPYMFRWFVIPRAEFSGTMLHRIVRSDKDVHHDHPWDYTTMLLDGSYVEERLLRDGSLIRHQFQPGDIIRRKAADAHRLILLGDQPVTTLFLRGAKVREWGFHCPGGWVHWRDFTNGEDRGRVGRGCGDLA